tara:strand:+ start:887 stop:1327 length:441 start_codon:yes stop_codon:yes gene_type:complete
MAIIVKTEKPYVEDKDSKVYVGLDLPLTKGNTSGYFEPTLTTMEAVKNNIRSLLNTEKGERLLQPSIGLNLKKYIFEPIIDDTNLLIEDEIINTFEKWLPFVTIKDLKITSEETDAVGKNKINIKILFGINRNNESLDSVEVNIGG